MSLLAKPSHIALLSKTIHSPSIVYFFSQKKALSRSPGPGVADDDYVCIPSSDFPAALFCMWDYLFSGHARFRTQIEGEDERSWFQSCGYHWTAGWRKGDGCVWAASRNGEPLAATRRLGAASNDCPDCDFIFTPESAKMFASRAFAWGHLRQS